VGTLGCGICNDNLGKLVEALGACAVGKLVEALGACAVGKLVEA